MGVGVWGVHSDQVSMGLSDWSPVPDSREAFPTNSSQRAKCPLREPASSAIAESHVLIGADFQISIGRIQGIWGSFAADVIL